MTSVERLVALKDIPHEASARLPTDPAPASWPSAGAIEFRSLQMRYRPDLPTAPRRERRDWVILFESSGARDPLVARAQVEVIRSLLANAEHDDTFAVLRRNGRFVAAMAVGSVVGSFIGGKLLGIVPEAILLPVLALILLVSSVKLWLHRRT